MGALIEVIAGPLLCLSPVLIWAWWNRRQDRLDDARQLDARESYRRSRDAMSRAAHPTARKGW